MSKVINSFLLVLLLVYSSQKTIVSNLNSLHSITTNVNVPSDYTKLVQTSSLFCVYKKINCKNFCISQTLCDSEDPYHSWKFEKNSDGTFHILNKKEQLYLTAGYESGYNELLGVLKKNPEKYLLVPSKEVPEAFYVKPSRFPNKCLNSFSDVGNFEDCKDEFTEHLYFLDSSSNDKTIVPNTFYSIQFLYIPIKRSICLNSLNLQFYSCSFQGPHYAFQFIPQDDSTFMIVDGLGEAAEVDYKVNSGNPVQIAVNFVKQDPSKNNQRWRVIRHPHYPDSFIVKIPSINYCLVGNMPHPLMVTPCHRNPIHVALYHLLNFGNACSERVVKDDVWYFFKDPNRSRERCFYFDLNEKRVKVAECEYKDNFLFKLIWDEQSHSYYIYNKSQGNNVLTVYPQNNEILDSRSGTFEPKKVPGDDTQRWNTGTRTNKYNIYSPFGFQIYNRYVTLQRNHFLRGFNFLNNEVGPISSTNEYPVVAESVEFMDTNKGILSSLTDTSDILNLPPYRALKCPSKVLYQIN
jgi:hypothetical protein